MRHAFKVSLAIVILAIAACKPTVDYEKERAAIIEVIQEETDAYLARDYDRLCAVHVQDSLNMRLTAGADNYIFLQGWDEVGAFMMSDMTEDDLSANHITVEKSNYRMKIYPNSAFVFFDQKWISRFGEEETELNSIQVRFLEKIEGKWKISCVSWIGTSGYLEQEETEKLYE
jgi:hypothetical protein